MEFKGTQRKWGVDPHDSTIVRSTNSDNGNIAECHASDNLKNSVVYVSDGTHWGEDAEIAKANAQLIAVAPEMLKVLMYLLRKDRFSLELHKRMIEDVIAKALGKEVIDE